MHIALILDGNRRWARSKGLPKFLGHKKGIDNLEKILKICAQDERITHLTAFALSTENFKREKKELDNLFFLIERFAKNWSKFIKHNIKVIPIGNLKLLPLSVKKALKELQVKTSQQKKLIFAPSIAFGGKDEIIRAVNKIIKKNPQQKINEKDFQQFLDTKNLPPVDLLIRTGGKKRLSNFLLWECAYAEILFLDKMWPQFSELDLKKAIDFWQKTQKNFGI